jgi:hypothetical protein
MTEAKPPTLLASGTISVWSQAGGDWQQVMKDVTVSGGAPFPQEPTPANLAPGFYKYQFDLTNTGEEFSCVLAVSKDGKELNHGTYFQMPSNRRLVFQVS